MPENSKAAAFLDKLKELKGKASEKFNQFMETAGPAIKQGLSNAGTTLSNGYNKVKSWAKEKYAYLQSEEFKEKVEDFKEDLSDAMDSIKIEIGDKLEDLKEKAKTSKKGRAIAIKGVSNAIKKVDPKNSKGIDRINKIIEAFELCDPDLGQIIDKQTLVVYADKLKQNPMFKEEVEELLEVLQDYPETSQTNEQSQEPKKEEGPKIDRISQEEIRKAKSTIEPISREEMNQIKSVPEPFVQQPNSGSRFKIIAEGDIALGSAPIDIKISTSPTVHTQDMRQPEPKPAPMPHIQTLGHPSKQATPLEIQEEAGPSLE